MAFFDEIGRKIVQVGTDAYAKTKDVTDIVKINSMISEQQKVLNQYYMDLGKKYYDSANVDEISVPDQLELFKKIHETIAAIGVYNEQIKALKGVEKCPYCNGDIVAGSQFCSHCGNKIVKTERPKCSVCGAPLENDALFCTNCGAKVDVTESDKNTTKNPGYDNSDHSIEILKETIRQRDPDDHEWKCQNCGNIQSRTIKRCLSCGELISEVAENGGETDSVSHDENISSDGDASKKDHHDSQSDPDHVTKEVEDNNSPAEKQMKKCAKCGAIMEMENLFCTECGHKFDAE